MLFGILIFCICIWGFVVVLIVVMNNLNVGIIKFDNLINEVCCVGVLNFFIFIV